MTIQNAIDWVDAVKPNAFTTETKFMWLNSLEGKLAADIFLMSLPDIEAVHYKYPDDLETELLVAPPNDDIYTAYLQAKIDEANGEYNKYANTMAIYNEIYGNFLRWFCGLYDPAQGYRSNLRLNASFPQV